MHFPAIIAEFNPLHRGHEKLINFARTRHDSEACVVILSSNFTQRGSPALIDKFLRAEMAIKAGADLVLELPFLYSCAAAQDFSGGAVEIAARTNFISHLVFGMENPEFDINPLVEIMLNESPDYRKFLRDELSSGASFPKANAIALEKIIKGSSDFISKPNNLLALSYILKIKKNNYDLKIMSLKREGDFKSKSIRDDFEKNSDMLPDFSREIILKAKNDGRLCDEKKLWLLLQSVFIRTPAAELKKIYGIDEGIENLFLKNWRKSESLNDFIGRCVCARYIGAHIRRRLIYILLGLDRNEKNSALNSKIPYVRILAFNQKGREILKNHPKNSEIKFITRLSEIKNKDESGQFFAKTEFKASQLYELLLKNSDMHRESNSVLKII